MRLFVVAGNLPFGTHTVRAANRVLHCLLAEITARGHSVALQVILRGEERREWTDAEQASIEEQRRMGVDVLPCVFQSDYRPLTRSRAARRAAQLVRRLARPALYFYPELGLKSLMESRVRAANADAILVFWNPECLAAVSGVRGIPKMVYYGMPDHAATEARFKDRELFNLSMSWIERVRLTCDLPVWEREHLRLMRTCDIAANLSADHALYYSRQGHPHSIYLPNVWPAGPVRSSASQSAPKGGRLKIVGSLGRPAATGNTYGLRFIGEEIVPRLDAALGADGYEMHLFGEGEPPPAVRRVLQSPSIRMRGWVADIDAEIESAHVFLVGNNAGRYRGSHTRFLHAWSLKACCIGHAYNKIANPEMVHRENVLLAETPEEFVELILEAFRDEALRRQVGEGGWETYQAHFTPHAVVGRLLQEIEPLVGRTEKRGLPYVAAV